MRVIPFLFIAGLFAVWPQTAWAQDLTLWQELIVYIREQQQIFHRQLADAIRAVQDGGIAAAWGLVVISFLYGIFHAAGPGHGKAIITTYLMTHESQLKKGIFLAFASAFVQGLSALFIVGVFVGVIGFSTREARGLESQLEQASFGLIALIGVYLIYRGIKAFIHMFRNIEPAHNHDHGHEHHDHDHEHHHHGQDCQVCGHSHAPDPSMLDNKASLKETLMIVFSVGIRPCSGSILVLVFAKIVGLYVAGVVAVFAVSFGTALTVSALAAFAVYFRKIAFSMSDKSGHPMFSYITPAMACTGGLVIFLLGLSLFNQTLQTSHPLF